VERAAVPGMIREQRLNQWIEDYSDSILRTCFLYLSDQTQAEDATQDELPDMDQVNGCVIDRDTVLTGQAHYYHGKERIGA